MLLNRIFKPLTSLSSKFLQIASPLSTSQIKAKYVDEPEYLKYTKPQVPVYELLNIQMKGYDYTILEHYGKHVHKIALNMDIDVVDAWATPHQSWKIATLQPNSTKIENEFLMNTYERNIQVANLAVYSAPTFFEIIQSSLPCGVTVNIHPHDPEYDEIRYIPDFELMALKRMLKEMTDPDPKKKK